MKNHALVPVLCALMVMLSLRELRAQSVSVEYLIVGGGGGGGTAAAGEITSGGGGGGAVRSGSTTLAAGNFNVAVGAGGTARSNGNPSSFNGITANGGGGGGDGYTGSLNGLSGATGGGAGCRRKYQEGYPSGTPGSGTQGYGGGGCQTGGGGSRGGGGGGAGGEGQHGYWGGNGGAGVGSSISGVYQTYGGGGGAEYDMTPAGSGAGGGGNGGHHTSGASGVNGRGGGGGGHGWLGGPGAGGSGLVIIRYPIGAVTATGGNVTTSGGYKIHTFTSSGTFVVSTTPTLTSVLPSAGNQGQSVSVTLAGTNFVSGDTTVTVSGADITVSGVGVTSATALTATFNVGWSAAVGTRDVTVTTSSGTSGSQSFIVSAQASPAGWLQKKDSGGAFVPSGVYEIDGRVGVGTQTPTKKLHVAGDLHVDGNIAAKYQDVAEWVDAGNPLPNGTVVVVDRSANRVVETAMAYDSAVIGVVSANPGVMLGEAGPGRILVAQSGRVRTKVDARYGAISRGDLLVTSPNPGHAMRSVPFAFGKISIHRPGTLIGKALEDLKDGTGEILVLLTLQ